MGDIPIRVEWYLAELIMEITVSGDIRNVVHRNLVLIRADSADEAYRKAVRFGGEAETSYKNPSGQLVQIKFGIARLDDLYEPLEDGAEIGFEELIGVSMNEINGLIKPKEQLRIFQASKPSSGPDYSSKDVLDRVLRDE